VASPVNQPSPPIGGAAGAIHPADLPDPIALHRAAPVTAVGRAQGTAEDSDQAPVDVSMPPNSPNRSAGRRAFIVAAIAGLLLLSGMGIPATYRTERGNSPGQQLVWGSILLSIASLSIAVVGIATGMARGLPILRPVVAAILCVAIGIGGAATVSRQVKQLDLADRLDSNFDYWHNFNDINRLGNLELGAGVNLVPVRRDGLERAQALYADIVRLSTNGVDDDIVKAVHRHAQLWGGHCNLLKLRLDILDKLISNPTEEENDTQLRASQQELIRSGPALQAVNTELYARFAGVTPWARPNQGWAPIILSCLDDQASATCSKGIVDAGEKFGRRFQADEPVTLSMESLEIRIDMMDLRKQFGLPDRVYRMSNTLRHVYGNIVFVTDDVTNGPPRELPVKRIGAPYSWWTGGLRRRAIQELNSGRRFGAARAGSGQ
jgi:hypothetical protein